MRHVLIAHPYHHVGGPDTFVTNIVRALGPRDWRCWIVVSRERPLCATLREAGATVVVAPELATLPRTVSPARLVRHARDTRRVADLAREIIEHNGIEVVHGVHETMWAVLGRLRSARVGRVVSVHGLRFASPAVLGRLNTKLLSAVSDRIICVSSVVYDLFRKWGVSEDKLAIVPSSVDLERFRPDVSGDSVRSELRIPAGALVVATVGSVDERKGQAYFVEACPAIFERHPGVHCLIVGYTEHGPTGQVEYLRALRARATALGLDGRLQFVPARPDVPEVMAAIDILVQPSLTEAGPRAPLEAMAMARPVVGTRVEALAEEVVDGETGLLVPPADATALSDAVGSLVIDRERRLRMGRSGRRRVEQRYSLIETAALLERTYQGAIDRARAGTS